MTRNFDPFERSCWEIWIEHDQSMLLLTIWQQKKKKMKRIKEVINNG